MTTLSTLSQFDGHPARDARLDHASRLAFTYYTYVVPWMGISRMTALSALTLDPDQGALRSEADQLATVLGALDRRATLTSPDGEQIELPAAIFDALAIIAEALRQGDAVTVIPLHHLLTTNQAADLLNVSRPYLLTILKNGDIPYEYVGTHRRLRLGDVIAYREGREAQRKESLKNLVRQAEELDLPY
jgi:excisionase family DNA binding protein